MTESPEAGPLPGGAEPGAGPRRTPDPRGRGGGRQRRSARDGRAPARGALLLRRSREHPFAPAAAVLAAVAVVVALGYATRPETASAGPEGSTERAPVLSTAVACPGADGSSGTTRLAVATTGDGRGSGRAAVQPVDGGISPPAAVAEEPNQAWYRALQGRTGGLAVRATGALAAGLEVEQTTRTTGTAAGLAGIRCGAPRIDHWFLGPGPGQAAGALYLSNIDATAATIDVDVFTPQGMVDPDGGRSITVDPHEHTVVKLEELVPNTRLTGVHVRATIGRVAAALRTRSADPPGVDWLPAASAPATDLVIPGLPKGEGERQLLLAAPGQQGAVVRIQAISSRGTFVPGGRQKVQIPGGTVIGLDVAAGLAGRAAAIRLTSDAPVTGGALVTHGSDSEVAFTAATPALDGSAVAAYNRTGGSRKTTLVLTAPGRKAEVRVTTVTPDGPAEQAVMVRIPSGRTVAVEAPAPRGAGRFALVVAPRAGSGPVYGARLLTEEVSGTEAVTVLPLVTARTWVTVPSVGDSLSAVVRDGSAP